MIINYANHLKLVASVKDHGSSATLQQCWKQTTLAVDNASIPHYINNFQDYWVFGFCPSSGILKTTEYNVSETGSVSVLR
jgi:hypothetical protein